MTVEQELEQETENDVEQAQPEEEEDGADRGPSFADLGVDAAIIEAVAEMGFEQPTEVQIKTIPLALERKDVLVQSRTGTGKTAAFAIPIVQRLAGSEPKVQALALAPTRELALQVATESGRIAAKSGVRVTAVYGGAAMGPQIDALRSGVHMVAATPGRVLDHIRRGNLDTSSIHTLVLDEGDEMLSMGFLEEIAAIIDRLPTDRHTMLFSATIPDEIQKLADRYTVDAARLLLSHDFIGVREIQHIYYLVSGSDRHGDLMRVLEFENPEAALIFCNTRDDTAQVADYLQGKGFKVEGISSDLTQHDRERVMRRMRGGDLQFLVATDIAARGIDLTDLSHVINYTFPESPDVYVHRTGRTGRAGKSGVAVSLVAPREIGSFYYLKLIHKIFPEERRLPSPDEMATRREASRYEQLQRTFAGREVSEEMRGLARRVWSTLDGERLMGLALAVVLEEHGEVYAAPPPRPEEPAREREPREGRGEREREDRPERDGRRRRAATRELRPRGRDRRGGRQEREGRGKPDRDQERRPKERKLTRTRRSAEEQGVFTTPDGDVEYWETVDDRKETEGTVRLFINLGRQQGVRLPELYEFVLSESGLTREQMERVQVRNSFSFFNVPAEVADSVIEKLSGKSCADREVRVERAKK